MDRARQFFSKIRGQVSGWIVTGSIIAITGFTPQEWAARLVRLFPAIETEWPSGVDLRLVLVGLGTTIVVCSVLLQHRALRRLGTVDHGGSATTADRQSAALAGGETPVRVDRAEPGREPTSPLLDTPSIAVLPFQNMSGDPEQEYFSDGITEDLITDLSKVSGLFVIARNSTFVYKGKAFSVPNVCRELGVKFAVEGSVRKAGNRVRITAQLSTERTADISGPNATIAISPTFSRSRTKSPVASLMPLRFSSLLVRKRTLPKPQRTVLRLTTSSCAGARCSVGQNGIARYSIRSSHF